MCLQNLMKFHQRFFKILRKHSVTDARSEGRSFGRTDGQRENSIPSHKHSLRGIITKEKRKDKKNKKKNDQIVEKKMI